MPLRQLENSLSKKDDADAMKHRDTLEAGLGELKAKFSKVDVAKQFIEQADAVLKRMETELGAIIAEKTVKVKKLQIAFKFHLFNFCFVECYRQAQAIIVECWALFGR